MTTSGLATDRLGRLHDIALDFLTGAYAAIDD
jgi:hypothetical protein